MILKTKFPWSLESLDLKGPEIIEGDMGLAEPELKHLIEALEKKAIRAERFVINNTQLRD